MMPANSYGFVTQYTNGVPPAGRGQAAWPTAYPNALAAAQFPNAANPSAGTFPSLGAPYLPPNYNFFK